MKAECEAKAAASFAGRMRGNLVSMLDGIGVQEALGLSTCSGLFSGAGKYVHTTSALRYPVFKNGRNYTGHSPALTKHPLLRKMLEELLIPELRAMPSALIVPLGKAVAAALDWLEAQGLVTLEHCLRGFPHPSGANGHRARQFERARPILRAAVRKWRRTLAGTSQHL